MHRRPAGYLVVADAVPARLLGACVLRLTSTSAHAWNHHLSVTAHMVTCATTLYLPAETSSLTVYVNPSLALVSLVLAAQAGHISPGPHKQRIQHLQSTVITTALHYALLV